MSRGTEGPVGPVPEHLTTVTARLVVSDGDAAIAFYERAFAAEELTERFTGPDGAVIHAEIRIGNAMVMITGEGGDDAPARSPAQSGVASVIMATYWEDVDSAWQRAVAAGAEIIYPLDDHFYGERGGRLRDPFGHQWMLSQRTEVLSAEEVRRRSRALMRPGAEA